MPAKVSPLQWTPAILWPIFASVSTSQKQGRATTPFICAVTRSGCNPTRSGRAFSCEKPVDALSPAADAADRRAGGSAAGRSRRDEFAHGEPALDDGVVLSPDGRETQDSGRVRSFPFGSVCGEVANPLSWV